MHAFVDEKGIAIPRGARSLYSMLESSVHPVRAPNRGAFHPKVWVARFTAVDGTAEGPAAGGGPVAEPDVRPFLGRRIGERGPAAEQAARGRQPAAA